MKRLRCLLLGHRWYQFAVDIRVCRRCFSATDGQAIVASVFR